MFLCYFVQTVQGDILPPAYCGCHRSEEWQAVLIITLWDS